MSILITDLFDLDHTIASSYLSQFTYPWEALAGISDFIISIGNNLSPDEFDNLSENVWIAKDATVFASAYIGAPCIIGHGTEVRHCAFIRGSVLIGDGCVIGNSTEIKNAILFDGVQVPHYNYIGDSILGYKAHMGAGSVLSNVKGDRLPVVVKSDLGNFKTGRKKFGAMLGDRAEIGCNSVLNPGTIIGRDSNVYPVSCVRGIIPEKSIYKKSGNIVLKR